MKMNFMDCMKTVRFWSRYTTRNLSLGYRKAVIFCSSVLMLTRQNIVGFGVDFEYDIDADKEGEEVKAALDREWARYENFFKYCNLDESFTSIMKKVIDDKERIGWGALEVIEDMSGVPAGLEHIPAHKIRLCKRETKAIPVATVIQDENGEEIRDFPF